MQIRNFETYPRLATALTVTFVLSGVLLVLLLLSRVSEHVVRFEHEVQAELVKRGAEGVQIVLRQAIEREWNSLGSVSLRGNFQDLGEARRFLETLSMTGDSIAWAAFADINGTIVVSSNRSGEGARVGGRRWFREGLVEGSIGKTTLHPSQHEPSFLDISFPVRDARGNTIGVLVSSIKTEWARQLMAEAATHLDVETALTDSYGQVPIDARENTAYSIPKSVWAQTRNGASGVGLLPRGMIVGEDIYSVIPNFANPNLPYLDLHLVALAPSAGANGSIASFAHSLFIWITGALAAATLAPILLVAHFIKPIERLAGTASALADGEHQFPDERCFSREAAMLSASIARLQTQICLMAQAPKNAPSNVDQATGTIHQIDQIHSTSTRRDTSRTA